MFGATRSTDRRRADRGGQAAAYAFLGLLGLAATLGAVVYAITLITTK